jgi:hypothetical protein
LVIRNCTYVLNKLTLTVSRCGQLLSSDDMWMFAPIAYNGFNVGLDLKIAPPEQ